MSLFDKKHDYSTGAPLYTLGASKTVLIIGLGNPGNDYAGTRHNVGFEALDHFAKSNDFPPWTNKKDLKSFISVHQLSDTRVILCKPTTFMNLSGQAVQAVQHFYKVYNAQTLVVYDELALPFGSLRTRAEGSDAGHNGVKSLIQHLGDDFGRLRIGVGNEVSSKTDSAKFVLNKFSKEEQESLDLVIKEACSLITEFLAGDNLPHDTRKVL